MDRNLLFWTFGLFFGMSIAFRAVQRLTEDQPLAVTLLAQVALLVVAIAAIVYVVKRRDRG